MLDKIKEQTDYINLDRTLDRPVRHGDKIIMTNSILYPGKKYEFTFTKKEYYRYLLQSIAWLRVMKLVLIIAGIIGIFIFKPLFLACGIICLLIDIYGFIIKKITWYFIFAYPLGYIICWSWYGLIYVSFLLGILNLIDRRSFMKMPYEIDLKKIKAQNKKIIRF